MVLGMKKILVILLVTLFSTYSNAKSIENSALAIFDSSANVKKIRNKIKKEINLN